MFIQCKNFNEAKVLFQNIKKALPKAEYFEEGCGGNFIRIGLSDWFCTDIILDDTNNGVHIEFSDGLFLEKFVVDWCKDKKNPVTDIKHNKTAELVLEDKSKEIIKWTYNKVWQSIYECGYWAGMTKANRLKRSKLRHYVSMAKMTNGLIEWSKKFELDQALFMFPIMRKLGQVKGETTNYENEDLLKCKE